MSTMSGRTLNIALAQMEVVTGQPSKNFEAIESFVRRAKDAGADLVVFPELCISGRFVGDKWHDAGFVNYAASFDERIRGLSDGIGIVFGNCTPIPAEGVQFPTPDADAYLSDVRFCLDGEWMEPDHECHCDDDCDCDGECDCDGDGECGCGCGGAPLYTLKTGDGEARITLFLGDVSGAGDHVSAHAEGLLHDIADTCDVAIDLAASPWKAHALQVNDLHEHHGEAEDDETAALPIVVRVNCVGMQNTDKSVLAFDGGSKVYVDGNAALACRDDFQEDLLLVSIDCETGNVQAANDVDASSSYADEDDKVLDAIVWSLRRFDEQVFPFKPKWIIGLSGGLDSSVTAALMHLAFGGSERIVGYNLATRYNSDATKMNAYELAKALDIRLVNGSIEKVVEATGAVAELYGYPEESLAGLVQENIQARVRGHLLSTFAAIEGGMVMNNGNKVEATLGYATLYGDAIGAIAPIGDVTKVRLFHIARLINERLGKEAIPMNLVPEETEDGYLWETMPSAELKDAQRDPMKWFYHDWVVENLVDSPAFGFESLMEQYLQDKLASTPVAKWVRFYGLDDPAAFIEDIEWLSRQVSGSVYKRIQTPPTIAVVRDTVSYDFRENQARYEASDRYRELRASILSMDNVG